VLEVEVINLGPDLFPQFRPCDQLSGTLNEYGEYLEWLRLERNSSTVLVQFAGEKI
jgi:hypothetical protein